MRLFVAFAAASLASGRSGMWPRTDGFTVGAEVLDCNSDLVGTITAVNGDVVP